MDHIEVYRIKVLNSKEYEQQLNMVFTKYYMLGELPNLKELRINLLQRMRTL